jgi:hypothetical protein
MHKHNSLYTAHTRSYYTLHTSRASRGQAGMLHHWSYSQLRLTAAAQASRHLMLCTYPNRGPHSLPCAETVQYTHRIINTTLAPTVLHYKN